MYKRQSLSGVGTVTLSPTGVDIAGITTAATLRATTGIVTSLTAGSLTSLGAVSGTTGTFSGAVSGTTGTFSGAVSGTTAAFTGNLSITNTAPQISLVDSDNNSDFSIYGAGGVFNIYDETNSASRLTIASDGTVSVLQGLELSSTLTIPDTIVHSGDTNTKIRFPAVDTITAETGGSERVRIDSSGRVGLGGQTSPSATIHIQDLSANGYELKLGGNAITFNRTSLSYIDQINDTGSLVFRTTSSQTNALTIASNGNITANAGNFVIGTSGKGIDFSATGDSSGTTTNEVFDDYEEGTFTPTSNATINGQYGVYTKIGRQVTIHIRLVVNSQSSGTTFAITGLPYSANMLSGLSNGSQPGGFGYISGSPFSDGEPQIHMRYNNNYVEFYNFGSGLSISTWSGREIRLGFIYYVD